MAETLSLSGLAEWRGTTLISADGQEIGEIREVVYDYLTGEAVWLGVAKAFVTLLVPARGAAPEGGRLRCVFTKEKIERQPPSDFGQGFANLGEERHLYEYFGLTMDREPELRVLLEGDDLPGLER
jgi:hypothetical protein